MAKASKPVSIVVLVVAVGIAAWLLLRPGAGADEAAMTPPSEFADQTIVESTSACRLVLAGGVPEMPGRQPPVTDGFIDTLSWDSSDHRLHITGWAPFPTRSSSTTLIVRDPFGLLTFAEAPSVESYRREDVVANRPNQQELIDSGFKLAVASKTGEAGPAAWLDSIEVYAAGPNGQLARLSRTGEQARKTWDRRPGNFGVTVVFAAPGFGPSREKTGNLDVFEPDADAGTVLLHGWGNFDGGSERSMLVVQLPPSAAPASILRYSWNHRPDAQAAVDPDRPGLLRSGFDVELAVQGSPEALREPGALHIWSIDAGQPAVPVVLRVLHPGKD